MKNGKEKISPDTNTSDIDINSPSTIGFHAELTLFDHMLPYTKKIKELEILTNEKEFRKYHRKWIKENGLYPYVIPLLGLKEYFEEIIGSKLKKIYAPGEPKDLVYINGIADILYRFFEKSIQDILDAETSSLYELSKKQRGQETICANYFYLKNGNILPNYKKICSNSNFSGLLYLYGLHSYVPKMLMYAWESLYAIEAETWPIIREGSYFLGQQYEEYQAFLNQTKGLKIGNRSEQELFKLVYKEQERLHLENPNIYYRPYDTFKKINDKHKLVDPISIQKIKFTESLFYGRFKNYTRLKKKKAKKHTFKK